MTFTTMRVDNGWSPTKAIYYKLKPYWDNKILDDQDWAYVLVCLRKVESQCPHCMGKGECFDSNSGNN